MMVTIKVFISSRISELAEERAIADQAVAELDLVPNRFETWPATPRDPRGQSLAEVADSDIFILILGTSISQPVIEEYEMARDVLPDRILVFVRKGPRSPGAEGFLRKLAKEYVYKTYRHPRKLGPLVQKAIGSLMRDLLRRKDEPSEFGTEEVVVEETVVLDPGDHRKWEFDVESGDSISGIVDELDGEPLEVYLMSIGNYVLWKNGERFEYYGEERTGAFEFQSVTVDDDGTWYLVLRNPAHSYDREVRIRLVRLSLG